MAEKLCALRSERDAARLLGVSERTLQRWRRDGGGPAFIRLGARRIAYSDAEIERCWAAARTYPHRAAELAHAAG
jgi:predicted DNA-binding transcriptional regulator AlpA